MLRKDAPDPTKIYQSVLLNEISIIRLHNQNKDVYKDSQIFGPEKTS